MTSRVGTDLRTIFQYMPATRRRELILLSILMPVTAAAEMLMVAAIVPVLAILGGTAKYLPMLPALLDWVERVAPGSSLFAAAALFVFTALVTAMLRLALSWSTLHFAAQLGHDLNMTIQHKLLHQPYLFHASSNSKRTSDDILYAAGPAGVVSGEPWTVQRPDRAQPAEWERWRMDGCFGLARNPC